ncbi:HD-GYP domain-containing protein [Fimbriimonas ginsengisoli]|uniref:HD-GYP domain-containing protein n=1 Tax=Fimbriimonas ginsengisoli TaxID=1005039 RepID=UPI00046CB4EB|nr:HD domain-containing protein [Fimbriimonas ginsengisoli]
MESSATPTLAEILDALSRALDLTEGQPRGHSARTAMVALRIGQELRLTDHQLETLYYAALIKDSGCSANSRRIQSSFGGDELLTKQAIKFVDWSNPTNAIGFAVRFTEPDAPPLARLQKLLQMAGPPSRAMDAATSERCERGAEIARRLGFDDDVALAILDLDEHWDGHGAPRHLSGFQISIVGRILCLAQTLELFVAERGRAQGYTMLAERSGRWFDPDVVSAARAFEQDERFWASHADHRAGRPRPVSHPGSALVPTAKAIDDVCGAFADVVDAKSGYTAEHSSRVTEYAVAIAQRMGIGPQRISELRRAALLHDIGKLGVSNAILDKPGRLDAQEFESVKRHPRYTYEILSPIRGFGRITEIAAAHHERLDGRGYWRGLTAVDLDEEMRILAVADIYDALTAKRPYRDAMTPDDAIALMWREAGQSICPDCLAALEELKSLRPDRQELPSIQYPVPLVAIGGQ